MYVSDVVLPLKIQISSLQVMLATEMMTKGKHQQQLWELEVLDEKHLKAHQKIELYQARISKAFNKKGQT